MCNLLDISHSVQPSVESQSVDSGMYRVSFHGTFNDIQIIRIKMYVLDILMKLYWCVVFFLEGKYDYLSAKTIFLPGMY